VLNSDFVVAVANRTNKLNALRTALLLLPPRFTSTQLFETITSLSYMGDFRTMIRAENPNKIRNIVALQLDEFEKLYLPLMINLSDGSNLILSRSTVDMWEVHIFQELT
jgi:translocator assembly and maintenance protein 41